MTCVAGIETPKGTVILGGDSCSGTEDANWLYEQPKVFVNGEYALGFAGSWRVGQLIRFSFIPPTLSTLADDKDDDEVLGHMVNRFVPRLRETFDNGGYDYSDKNANWDLLVGVCGRLYEVHTDFHIARTVDGFLAIGGGQMAALGALAATPGMKSGLRLLKALEIAEAYCPSVQGPFTFAEV